MKKRNLLLVILAVLLVFGMVMSCGPVEEEEPVDVVFTGAGANGNNDASTTALTLTFDTEITGLTASHITLSSSTGATKGALSGSGQAYNLAVSGITSSGTVTITVANVGKFNITGTQTVQVVYSAKQAAAKYFGEYRTVYMLNNKSTNEFVTIEKDSSGKYVLTIEEKQDGTPLDKFVFAINDDGWESATVPLSETNADTSNRGTFTVGFKIKGKVTSVTPGYSGSNKTNPDRLNAGDDGYISLFLGDWIDGGENIGYLLLRTCFSKDGTKITVVTGDGDAKRVYTMEVD